MPTCKSGKVLNPKSNRCVVKSGRVGKALQGSSGSSSSRSRMETMNYSQILAQLPKQSIDTLSAAKRVFGNNIKVLTRGLAKKLVGETVYVVWHTQWTEDEPRKSIVRMHIKEVKKDKILSEIPVVYENTHEYIRFSPATGRDSDVAKDNGHLIFVFTK